MDIFVTEKSGGRSVQFPALPERIKIGQATGFATYDILDLGTVKIPSVLEIGSYSWSGMLPGEGRRHEPWIHGAWQSPQSIQTIFSHWRVNGTELRLMIIGTPINHDVYLSSYDMEYHGAYGDADYSIEFIDARNIEVSTTKTSKTRTNTTPKRSAAPTPATHTVTKNENLWIISQKYLGSGSNYPKLYEANKSIIDQRNKGTGNSKYTVYPGQVLKLPKT